MHFPLNNKLHGYYSHTGVYLSLKGTVYANNSLIPITEIGETNPDIHLNEGLQCITDRMSCCKTGKAGEWYFPDGTGVPVLGTVADGNRATTFYRNRGDNGTVNLNRVNTNVMSPAGLFCCQVHNTLNQTACINIGK